MTTLTYLGAKDGFRLRITDTSAGHEPQTLNQAVQSLVRDMAEGTLRRFRRENRSILENCLGAALRFLAAQRPA